MGKILDKVLYEDKGKLLYDWKKIEKIDEFAILKKCEQNPLWHREGNSWIHTKKVCEAMEARLKEYRYTYKKHPKEVKILMAAALFHDIGKGVTTAFKKGNWHAYGHEVEGEKITRRLLWDEGAEIREQICSLVRWHMEPLRIFEGKEQLEKIARLSKHVNIKYLCILKECDLDGSDQSDANGKNEDYAKLKEIWSMASHMNCLSQPSVLPLDGKYAWKHANDKRDVIDVYVMLGLPGAGKDTFIYNTLLDNSNDGIIVDANNKSLPKPRKNVCVLCRDDIRVELGFCKAGEKAVCNKYQEDKVTKTFNDRLKTSAETGKDIIINNINLRKEYRERILENLSNFKTRIHYVYMEADSLETNITRRSAQIPRDVFEHMISGFEWPTCEEYDDIFYFFT